MRPHLRTGNPPDAGQVRGIAACVIPALTILVALVSGCGTMQASWERAAALDTIAAYGEFLQEHPEGDLAERARLRRTELSEARDWQEAEQLDSVSAYERYLGNHPQGRHRDDARRRLETLAFPKKDDPPFLTAEAFLRRQERGPFLEETLATLERGAFEQALRGNTWTAYEAFLRQYPSGRYAAEARRRMDLLQPAEERARDGGAAPEGASILPPQGRSGAGAASGRDEPRTPSPQAAWGQVMQARGKANIRAKRSTASALKGQLAAGQRVRADFLRDGWYAVFPLSAKKRDEKGALGYVHAPLLAAAGSAAASPGATEARAKPAAEPPARDGEALHPAVQIKDIALRAGADGKEFLCVQFDRFCTPAVSGAEGDEPKILLEIDAAAPLARERTLIEGQGRFVRRVVARRDAATGKALIVLHMEPAKSYLVNPKFFARDSTYCLEIAEEQPAR